MTALRVWQVSTFNLHFWMVDKTAVLLWQDMAAEEHGTNAAYRFTIAINHSYHDQGMTVTP